MKLWTDAIDENNGYFDGRYTCDIDNSSPELRWEGAPTGTAGLALIAQETPDPVPSTRGVLWVVYQIPGNVSHLPAGIPPQDALPNGIRQGSNGLGKLGYAGPCPARGDRPRRYEFRLFALSALPELPHRATRDQLLEQIRPFALAEAAVGGFYSRMIERTG